jgi:hypothetical protein
VVAGLPVALEVMQTRCFADDGDDASSSDNSDDVDPEPPWDNVCYDIDEVMTNMMLFLLVREAPSVAALRNLSVNQLVMLRSACGRELASLRGCDVVVSKMHAAWSEDVRRNNTLTEDAAVFR